MGKPEKTNAVCTSFFRDGSDNTTKEQFTKAWIALIRRLEKERPSSIFRDGGAPNSM